MWEWDYKESWAPKNWCFWTVVLEKTLESHLDCKEIQPVYPKGDQSWVFIGRTDFEAETPILWPLDVKNWLIWRPWCWERPKAGGEGDDRGWDGWMAPPTRWTWLWVSSRSWWWTGRPGVLQSMGSQRVGHDWVTELNYVAQQKERPLNSSPQVSSGSTTGEIQEGRLNRSVSLNAVNRYFRFWQFRSVPDFSIRRATSEKHYVKARWEKCFFQKLYNSRKVAFPGIM